MFSPTHDGRREPDERLDARADVVDPEVGAHERDHVGRVLHEVAEVRPVALDLRGRLLGRGRRRTERARDEREAEEGRARDRVRDRRPQDRRRDAERDRDLAAEDRDAAPAEAGLPRARSVRAHRVGDPDAEPDHEDRAPAGRVDDPRGADRGGRRAQLQAERRRHAVPRSVCTSGVGRAARDQQHDEQPERRVGDQVRALQPRARRASRPGPAVKTSSDAPTTPMGVFGPGRACHRCHNR